MGIVFQANKGLIRDYIEETVKFPDALIEPGKPAAEVKLAPMSSEEVKRLLLKLDMISWEKVNPSVAAMVAEEASSIITAVRMVKTETKAEFMGMLGSGANLDITWLRPKHVGGPLLNAPGATGKGLYGGTSGGVLTWTHTFTGGTAEDIIPEQVMAEEAAVVHLGFIDTVSAPKVEAVQFKIAGIPTPAQPLAFNLRASIGTETLPLARFEKPVIIGPEKKQQVTVFPNISGDSSLQLLTLLVAKAESLSL